MRNIFLVAFLFSLSSCILMPGSIDLYLHNEFYGIGKGFPVAWHTAGPSSLAKQIFLLPLLGNFLAYFIPLVLIAKKIWPELEKPLPRWAPILGVITLISASLLSAEFLIQPTFQFTWSPFVPSWESWRIF